MSNCPICNTKTTENAKYCAECGASLSEAVAERAWIVAMQENIRAVRHNDVIYYITGIVGLLIAVIIPFVMRYVLLQNLTMTGWLLIGIGVLLFIGGFVISTLDDRKVKKLIKQLAQGQPPKIEPAAPIESIMPVEPITPTAKEEKPEE